MVRISPPWTAKPGQNQQMPKPEISRHRNNGCGDRADKHPEIPDEMRYGDKGRAGIDSSGELKLAAQPTFPQLNLWLDCLIPASIYG